MAALPTYHQRSLLVGIVLSSVLWIVLIVAGLGRGRIPHQLSISTCNNNNRALAAVPGEAARLLQERVLILAVAGRTGSSFVGQLFGANKDSFYLFEPGVSLQISDRAGGKQVLANVYPNMLRDLFQCDFSRLDLYLRYLSGQNMRPGGLQLKAPRLYEVCARRFPGRSTCQITQDMAAESCRTSKYVVVKSIRILDINLLLPMMTDDRAIGLKVIHLVRDPRPMVASSVTAFGLFLNLSYAHLHLRETDTLLSGAVQGLLSIYCKYNWDNLELGTWKPSLRDRYLFLRYEDAANDPLSAAGRIYTFLGVDHVPESVVEWIEANTKSRRPGIYSTARRSGESYRAWRRTISYKDAREIEGLGDCRGMMTRMGYRLLEDEQHLRNMSRSLVEDMPPTDKDKYDWPWWSSN